ncbi:MAG: hypothetical protein ACI867_001734 [Glaciecola sp.]|jgi:hypothetical protein
MNTNRLLATTLVSAVLAAAGLASLGGAALDRAPDPAAAQSAMLLAYATDFPLAMAAPSFVPDGFSLVDGDGPWTQLDMDGDGTHETYRAELLYAPAEHAGMPPLMMSMESQHDLSSLAGGYEQVTLPNGLPAWLSSVEESAWDALLWNFDGLTFGIQSTGIPIQEMLAIAASMEFIQEG